MKRELKCSYPILDDGMNMARFALIGHDLCASEQTLLVLGSLGWLQLVSFG